MFVRWKKRMQTRYHRPTGVHALTAVLVRSERVAIAGDSGPRRPRQRQVCYLGTIRENATGYHYHRLDFWRSAAVHLDGIGLDGPERARIEAALEKVVPRPDDASRTEAAAQLRELTAGIRRKTAGV